MSAAVLKKQFEAELGGLLNWQSRPQPDIVSTGIAEVDGVIGGLPRGSLTEIFGPASSGRTSLLISILAEASARRESCALVDAADHPHAGQQHAVDGRPGSPAVARHR